MMPASDFQLTGLFMRFLSSILCAASVAWFPGLASAQVVTECDWVANPANIMEPWEQNARTYANGNIRIAALDTGGEPVCCSMHLLVLSPSGDGSNEPIFRQCRVVSARPGQGFLAVDIPGTTASYDPSRGLLVSVPVGHWHQAV
ncbi:MAG: hypothetical protein R3D84_18515, partial [Paracoccaceae bacterium]